MSAAVVAGTFLGSERIAELTAAADGSALGNPGPAGWAWYIDDDRVVAAISVERSEDLQHARRLIEAGAR